MIIQYYGHSCFKLTTKPAGRGNGDVSVFFDPFDKSIGLRPPQGSADLVLVSHQHHDHNNVEAVKGEPQVIDIPGEYSVKGINIIGLPTYHDDKNGVERGQNTVYILETEDMRVCHMGDLGTELTDKQYDTVSGVDILMIPVGGNYTIDGEKAAKIVKKIEPKIIIPMHFKAKGLTVEIEDEKKFCDAIGTCPDKKVSKLNLKAKDLAEKRMEVILMSTE